MGHKDPGGNMRNRSVITALCLALGTLTMFSQALAHGTEMHDHSAPDDMQMHKLHTMMPMFSVASANLETALKKGESGAVETEAQKIIAAIPDLKKSKPHKNVKQQYKFVELATTLGKTVTATASLAKKGDFAGAKAAFKRVEETCAACHAKFRD
jgi:cytochrome c556